MILTFMSTEFIRDCAPIINCHSLIENYGTRFSCERQQDRIINEDDPIKHFHQVHLTNSFMISLTEIVNSWSMTCHHSDEYKDILTLCVWHSKLAMHRSLFFVMPCQDYHISMLRFYIVLLANSWPKTTPNLRWGITVGWRSFCSKKQKWKKK